MRHLVVGTAGHIDHGKSALVRALTGTDPDRLKEEQRRGITIELGFADMTLPAGVVSFVDVPGHERFVRHMVAGATGVDAALLVVAADQAVQPQTREHVDICGLLGLRRGVVALSKCDLVDDELREVVELELREFLAETFLADAPVIALSARTGSGLDRLREALGQLFDVVPSRSADGVARLPVDRSFVLRGFGTVVTGTLISGVLGVGDEVEVHPGGARSRIRGLQVHHAAVDRAVAGQRTAVNLQSLECDDVPRGSVLTAPAALTTTRRAWARLRILPGAPKNLVRGGPVRFHQGTAEVGARLRSVLPVSDPTTACVEIFLDDDALLVPGDRFILRRPAPVDTVAGGTIVDVHPPRRRDAAPELFDDDALRTDVALRVRLARAGVGGRDLHELAAELGTTDALIEGAAGDEPVRIGRRLIDSEAWKATGRAALEAVLLYHREEPLSLGIARETLRARVAAAMPQELWRRLLEELQGSGEITLQGESVAARGHEVVLGDDQRELAERIEARFLSGGLEPPDPDEVLGTSPGASRIVELLVARGRLVRIHDGKLFHADALEELRRKLRQFARKSSTIDVATFKELAGVTRKHAIPLLEQLDAERTTRRAGNVREILAAPEG